MSVIAIALAALSAVCLAYGAHFQHAAVAGQETTSTRLTLKRMWALLHNWPWLRGLLFLTVGLGLNVVALAIAPVMLVQPVGAISLIVSVLLGMHYRGLRLSRQIVVAIVACTVGVAAFVASAALVARSEVHLGADAYPLAWITGSLGVGFGLVALLWRDAPQLFRVIAAGILFACVATTMHVVSFQFLHAGIEHVGWVNVATLLVAGLVGSWYVQTAYASGPPELVIAGLTVVDPIVAVLLGAIVLGEAAGASALILVLMIVTGAVACGGVLVLSRFHPDVLDTRTVTVPRRAVIDRREDSASPDQHNGSSPANPSDPKERVLPPDESPR